MKIISMVLVAVCGTLGVSAVSADATDKLIKMDKHWGEARKPAEVEDLFPSSFLSVNEDGLSGKDDLLKGMMEDDAPSGPYVAGDYQVEFLDKKTAVMVHSVDADGERHWSMHVWRKSGGKWQVAATASVEENDD